MGSSVSAFDEGKEKLSPELLVERLDSKNLLDSVDAARKLIIARQVIVAVGYSVTLSSPHAKHTSSSSSSFMSIRPRKTSEHRLKKLMHICQPS